MRFLVTGGCGFIGSHLVHHLTAMGDEVLNIDKLTYAARPETMSQSPFLQLDICDTQSLVEIMTDYAPDAVLHLAAETHVDNSIESCKRFVETNVGGTASVLDACKATKTRICHVSTDEVYGPASSSPYRETSPLNPQNPYSATKAGGDALVQAYHNTHDIEYLIVRPSNNYGPGQNAEKFIPKLLSCIRNGRRFPMYGSGDQMREWTFVEDTAQAIRCLTTSPMTTWNAAYNVSSGIMMTNLQVVSTITAVYNEETGKGVSASEVLEFVKDRPGHDRKYWIDASKSNEIIDLRYTDFLSGVRRTIQEM